MLFLQEVGDLLSAAVVLADGPDELFDGQAYLAGGARLLLRLLVLLQKGEQSPLCNGLDPEADGAPVFAESLGDAGLRQPLGVSLPG